MERSRTAPTTRPDHPFLPHFHTPSVVLTVLAMGVLLSVLLALDEDDGPFLAVAGQRLLFIECIALISLAVLGLLRDRLNRLNHRLAAMTAWLVVVVVSLICAETVWVSHYSVALPSSNGAMAEFLIRVSGISAIVSALALHHLHVREQWRRQMQAESTSRLQAFQARMRPHFLFNSLNTVAALTRSDPKRAERAVEDLADIFRATLGAPRRFVALEEELEVIERHLEIESLRLGERLQVDWRIDRNCPEVAIPPLVVQPLVENAVYHGIEPRADGGTITIAARRHNGLITIEVTNPKAEPGGHRSGNHIAMENVYRCCSAVPDGWRLMIRESSFGSP